MGTTFNAFVMVCGAVMASQAAFADAPKPIGAFSSVCEEKASVGFSWINGEWKQATFNTQKYIVRKVTNFKLGEQADGSVNLCTDHGKPDELGDDKIHWLSGCYTASRMGQPQLFEWCREAYEKTGATWSLLDVYCENAAMTFVPNGMFTVGQMSSSLSAPPKAPKRDSLSISHGDCGVIG